jgi:uncharacterized protein YjbI with pentapeptide repeats
MSQNYSNKNFRGHDFTKNKKLTRESFEHSDLREANFYESNLTNCDFSHADVRGCNFEKANLTGARFCKARMGQSLDWSLLIVISQLFLGSIFALISLLAMIYSPAITKSIISSFFAFENNTILYALLILFVSEFLIFLRILINHVKYEFDLIISGYGFVITVFSGIYSMLESNIFGIYILFLLIISSALFFVLLLMDKINGLRALKFFGLVVIGIVFFAIYQNNIIISFSSYILLFMIIFASYVYLALHKNKYIVFRNKLLTLMSLKGTNFDEATLYGTIFSEARIEQIRLHNAKIEKSIWKDAVNMHLANTIDTIFESGCVQRLLCGKPAQNDSFNGLNMKGICLKGYDLIGLDFSGANLIDADLSQSNLESARLTNALLLNADLSDAKMTGSYISHWNINHNTNLNKVECHFVYIEEEQKMPKDRLFGADEFTLLYQEIGESVCFLLKNYNHFRALSKAFSEIRKKFRTEKATIIAVEFVGGQFRIKIQSPEKYKKDLRNEYEKELDRLKSQPTDIDLSDSSQNELLKSMNLFKDQLDELRNMINKLKENDINNNNHALVNNHIHLNGSNDMNQEQKSPNLTINGNIGRDFNNANNDSNINTGNGSINSSNYSNDINSHLLELEKSLESCYDKRAKDFIAEHINSLRQASEKPWEEQKKLASKSIDALETVTKILSPTEKIVSHLEKVLPVLAKLFGLTIFDL